MSSVESHEKLSLSHVRSFFTSFVREPGEAFLVVPCQGATVANFSLPLSPIERVEDMDR